MLKMSLAPIFYDGRCVGQICHFTVEGAYVRRVHALEEREHFVTDAVATVFYG